MIFWVAVFSRDAREAAIVNADRIPAEAADGSKAQFFITAQSKRGGIKTRFERFDK